MGRPGSARIRAMGGVDVHWSHLSRPKYGRNAGKFVSSEGPIQIRQHRKTFGWGSEERNVAFWAKCFSWMANWILEVSRAEIIWPKYDLLNLLDHNQAHVRMFLHQKLQHLGNFCANSMLRMAQPVDKCGQQKLFLLWSLCEKLGHFGAGSLCYAFHHVACQRLQIYTVSDIWESES